MENRGVTNTLHAVTKHTIAGYVCGVQDFFPFFGGGGWGEGGVSPKTAYIISNSCPSACEIHILYY